MKTYSNRFNAKRAATKQKLDLNELYFVQDDQGGWYWETPEQFNAGLEQHLIAIYGAATCPHCGTGLDNGVVDIEMMEEAHGKTEARKQMTHTMECMACGGGFGEELKAAGTRRQYHRTGNYTDAPSEVIGVQEEIFGYLDQYYHGVDKAALPGPTAIAAELRPLGINRNSAAAGFNKWKRSRYAQ